MLVQKVVYPGQRVNAIEAPPLTSHILEISRLPGILLL